MSLSFYDVDADSPADACSSTNDLDRIGFRVRRRQSQPETSFSAANELPPLLLRSAVSSS
jgi:hypothetical protein